MERIAEDPRGRWTIDRGPWRGGTTRLFLVAHEDDGRAGSWPEGLRGAEHPGLARLVGEEPLAGSHALVVEDPGGASLKTLVAEPQDTGRVLSLAIAMASALEALHGVGAVHGRLEAECWVLDAEGTGAVLVELASAASPPPRHEPWVERRAPEQVDGPPDARSDLHALGDILYELCVGAPRFDAVDPLEGRHLALTARPVPPRDRNPAVPAGLSEIVMRLLATDPRDRYPSAAALRADLLHARRRYEEEGDIPGLPPRPLVVHEELVGREAERALLKDALSRASAGECLRVEIVGAAGIGKSTLIETLRVPTRARGGCFGLGRVDPVRAPRPLGALAGALDEIAAQLLSGDAARLERVRRAVARAVGPNCPLIAALGHRLVWLVSPSEAAPRDVGAAAAAARLLDTVERFVLAVAQAAPPLVLALDDLHRADAETVRLYRALTRAPDAGYLLLVGGMRPVEATSGPAPDDGALRVDLRELDTPAIEALVRASLGDLGGSTAPLVRLVERRTRGNPFNVGAYLRHLVAVGAIRAAGQREGFAVDLDVAAAADVDLEIAAILVRQLGGLPEAVRDALAVGARIGSPFPTTLVAEVLGRPVPQVEALLIEAAEAGVVARVPALPEPVEDTWRFLHDRLHQEAFGLRDGAAAAAVHARLGSLLCAALGEDPEAETLLRAVHQRVLGAAAITTPAERDELVRWALRAAAVARTTGAFEAALGFVDAAFAQLGADPWRLPDAAAALYLEGARAAVVAAPDRVNGLIDALVAHTSDPLLAAEGLELRVDHDLARDDANAALGSTRAALDRLGYRLPERVGQGHVALALGRAFLALRGRSHDALVALPEVADTRAAAVLRVLLRGSTAAYLTDPNLFIYLCCEMVRVGVRAGACPGTAWGLLVFAIVQSNALGDLAGGYKLGAAALRMLDRFAPHGLHAKSMSVWYATQHHTHHPLRESLQPIEDAVRRGLAEGDSLHSGINAAFYVNHLVFSGERLDRVARDAQRIGDEMERRRQDISIETSAPFRELARCLAGTQDPATLLEEPPPPTERPFQTFTVHFCRCVLAVLYGRDVDALAYARLADPAREAVGGTVNEPLFLFYAAVAAGRALCFGGVADRANRRRLRVGLAAMRKRVVVNPVDYASRVALLAALDLCARGRPAEAIPQLDTAVRAARSRGAPHEAALALETSARLHEQLGADETANLLWAAAVEAWRAWGAGPLAIHAAERLGSARPRAIEGPRPDPNVEVVLRATEALAGEVGSDALLASLVRLTAVQAGAERVVLLAVGGDDLLVRAVHDNGVVTYANGIPLARYERACAAAARLAQRTGEVVLEPEADRPEAFGDDPWVRAAGVRAVLALPVFMRGALTSVLLLEHTHRSAAFATTSVGPLRMLASVATALLENAELLGILEIRAAQLRTANQSLQAHSRLLEEAVRARTAELDALTRLQASVLDALSEGVCGLGADGRVTFANSAAATLLGVPVQDLVGMAFHDAFHAADPDVAANGPCALCEASAPRQDVPARLRGVDGVLRWVECAVQPDGGVNGAEGRVLSFRDVGRRRELEAQVRHGQKMEAIGLFVGGVAHEFNNLLTPILGRVEMARESLGPAHPLQDSLGSLERAGERAAELVRRLLALGRRTEMARKPTDLSGTVSEALRFLRPTLDRRIALAYTPDGPAWALADHGQVHQILLNLCLNARDALLSDPVPERPMRIEIALRRREYDEAAATADPSVRPGSWIELEVADTGPGMPPDVLSRIFEPFFTTKKVGEGSGLGLAVLHGIVQQHGGWVSVTSAPGKGTRFRCTFPATVGTTPAEEAAPSTPGHVRRGARILLVDDEQMVRGVTRSALERHGYDVDEAVDGTAALDLLISGRRPDAIVLDLMMPGLDGWRTLTRIRELDPTLPVVVMSGYDSRAAETRTVEPDAQLSKPFHLRDLIATVGRVIGTRATR